MFKINPICLAFLALLFITKSYALESYIIGISGTEYVEQFDTVDWHTVTFEQTFEQPVVFMQLVSNNGAQPAHIRLRNVQTNSFEYKIEEWAYSDGYHPHEQINYLVLEQGQHRLMDDRILEVGVKNVSHRFRRVRFQEPFSSNPIVYSQAQTFYDPDPVVTRLLAINTSAFYLKLAEEERKGIHSVETVGYMALDNANFQGQGATLCPSGLCAFYAQDILHVDHDGAEIPNLMVYIGAPTLLAAIQTYYGRNTATARLEYIPYSETAYVYIEEEQSQDVEIWHKPEVVGAVLIEGNVFYGYK